ncbi:glycosyltransferase [Arthrobacter sp. zg-Y411]|uniref:glycosyltransferase n=1 Tax=Arthrobacter TaxID=1663 RepID=UPI001D1498E1|nr:glycosyltransferase [Arthrobacter sp. YD2]MCC3293506.1 glycosyltransferase [Arthrobacter zhangbolii]MDN3904664.1 glycosyltransferase [Arthrobacter sp. YD2]
MAESGAMADSGAVGAAVSDPVGESTVRVASVPHSQVYIRHTGRVPGDSRPGGVLRLPDPDPRNPGQSTESTWWPPVMLDPHWIRENASTFDLMHIHFGFDAISPRDLRAVTAELKARGKPLVYTVHDLRNPHHLTPEAHDAQLDVLIPAADRLITLTPGAAAAVEARWGRRPVVLPHPHVVELGELERRQRLRLSRPPQDRFRVGVHLKSLRPNMLDGVILPALTAAVEQLPGAVLQVNGHPDILTPGGDKYRPELHKWLTEAETAGRLELQVRDYFDETALWDYLGSLDVSVLPYRFGTHSGWLEACTDLGTSVLAPSCGFYAQQRSTVAEFVHTEDGLDEQSLATALKGLYAERPWPGLSRAERTAERRAVAAAHEEIYASVLAP